MLIRFLDRATCRPTLRRQDAEVFGQRNYTRFVNDEIVTARANVERER